MLFNSIPFLLFFPLVLAVYYSLPASWIRGRNLWLLAASYYFYMNWEPVYALLLLTCTMVTYLSAIGMEKASRTWGRKFCLIMGIVLNMAILFLFKYYDFLASEIAGAIRTIGLSVDLPGFGLLLPVGISFYTFQAVGYSIDVYRGTTTAERDFFTYALFVSFFPQLVAGPIERSGRLLPQFREQHRFDYGQAMTGLKLMVWGYFLKLALADRCSLYVDAVFNHVESHNGGSYLLASLLFPFQIYGDFAGYSLIAIGAARIMGFRLMENFRRPYFAASVGEFWHRWHISLSTWFRDYVYIPLGGSRVNQTRCCVNLLVTFAVSGIWHGANWTFLCWGFIHGVLICTERILGIGRHQLSGTRRLVHCMLTFILVSLAWIFFRADDLGDAITVLTGIFFRLAVPDISYAMFTEITAALAAIAVVICREWVVERGRRLNWVNRHPMTVTHTTAVLVTAYILLMGVMGGEQFIYFQF